MTIPISVEDLLRECAPQVVAALTHRAHGDFDLAEDATQEALLAAATQWPVDGLPDNPRAWLISVGQRKLTDAIRSEIARRRREEQQSTVDVEPPATTGRDDTLALFFLCSHPSLSPAAAIALTLRAVGGLRTDEIAKAFMVPEATMAQRISRAKKKLSTVDRPFARPDPDQWHARLGSVLHVLYLMFTEGHTTTSGPDLHRADLSGEAIRLTRAIARLLPDDPEVGGLLALMLLTDARTPGRLGPVGELIPLAEQDRSRWDRRLIAEGLRLSTATLAHGLTGPYQLQAAIAAVHCQATHVEDTDWPRITALYRILERVAPNPLVTLSRAVATAMTDGPAAGLAIIDALAEPLAGNHRLDAVRAHLLEMSGDPAAAAQAYALAATRTTSTPERDYLLLRASRLGR